MIINDLIKNILWIAIVVAVLVGGYSAYIYSQAFSQSIQPSAFRNFAVSGEGKITAVPDVAQFTLSVITQGDKDLSKSQAENSSKMNKIIQEIKAQGVDTKDIKTQNYSVEPRYQYYNCSNNYILSVGMPTTKPCPPAEIAGYTITQTTSVKIRDFSKLGAILAKANDLGANSVSQLSFTIDDKTKIENQAREQAINQAKEKAQSVAKAGGFKIGKLLVIEEGQNFTPYRYDLMNTSLAGEATSKSVSPTIEPGSQDIKVSVTLRYEIQ